MNDERKKASAEFLELVDLLPEGFQWGDSLYPGHMVEIRSAMRAKVIEECCAAIKAEDDREMENGDYMLDSNDCIRVCRALKSQQDAAIESQRSGDGS